MRRGGAVLLALWLVLAGVAGARSEAVPPLLEPVGVALDCAPVQRRDLFSLATYTGAVTAYTEKLSFAVDGRLDAIYYFVGQTVKKGDIIATLDERDALQAVADKETEIARATYNLDCDHRAAEIDLEILQLELKELRADETATATDIALKEADLEEREAAMRHADILGEKQIASLTAELEELTKKTGRNRLIAPFDGRIAYGAAVSVGDSVEAYAPIFYLADDARLTITCDAITDIASERVHEVYALIGGGKYHVTNIAVSNAQYVAMLLSGVKPTTAFTIDAAYAGRGDRDAVAAGAYAAVCVVKNFQPQVLAVPVNAIFRDGAGRYVYVVDEAGVREKRYVKTGSRTNSFQEITEGLSEGESVYVKS